MYLNKLMQIWQSSWQFEAVTVIYNCVHLADYKALKNKNNDDNCQHLL